MKINSPNNSIHKLIGRSKTYWNGVYIGFFNWDSNKIVSGNCHLNTASKHFKNDKFRNTLY